MSRDENNDIEMEFGAIGIILFALCVVGIGGVLAVVVFMINKPDCLKNMGFVGPFLRSKST